MGKITVAERFKRKVREGRVRKKKEEEKGEKDEVEIHNAQQKKEQRNGGENSESVRRDSRTDEGNSVGDGDGKEKRRGIRWNG